MNGWFEFERDKSVYVNHYYFYIDDEDFGPLSFRSSCLNWCIGMSSRSASLFTASRNFSTPSQHHWR